MQFPTIMVRITEGVNTANGIHARHDAWAAACQQNRLNQARLCLAVVAVNQLSDEDVTGRGGST